MSVSRARAGTGVLIKLGDDTNQTVRVAAAAASAATTITVDPLAKPIANGKVLTFTGGKTATLTAAAAAGATTLTVSALAAALNVGDTANILDNFNTIAEVTDVTPPDQTTQTFETTHHSSPGNRMEFGVGMTDPGEMTFTVNWIPSDPTQNGTTGLRKVQRDRRLRNFQIVYPFDPPLVESFAGLVTTIGRTVPIGDRMTAQFTVRISGDTAEI